MNDTFCVKFATRDIEACGMLSEAAAQKVWETERFFVAHTVQTESKEREDDEKGDCLKKTQTHYAQAYAQYFSFPSSSISYHMITELVEFHPLSYIWKQRGVQFST